MSEVSAIGRGDTDFELQGWSKFFDELGQFLLSSSTHFHYSNEDYAHYVLERMEVCIVSLNGVKVSLEEGIPAGDDTRRQYLTEVNELLRICRNLSVNWEQKLELGRQVTSNSPPIERRAGRGRPKFVITREQLLYLLSMSFSWSNIAKMLGVSRMTIHRRRIEYSLTGDPRNVPTDGQLQAVVRQIKDGQPNMGEVMVMGCIRSMGYSVTRDRLRDVIRHIDPLHTALRWRGGLTARRPYSVPGPNSLWHIGKFIAFCYNIQNYLSRKSTSSLSCELINVAVMPGLHVSIT